MDILSTIIDSISNFISIPFIISVNIIAYTLIKNIELWNKDKVLTKIQKKGMVFAVNILTMAAFMLLNPSTTFDILLLSGLLTPYTYNYVMKNLLKTLGIEYNKLDLELM